MKKDSFKPLLSGLLFGVSVFCVGYVAFGATNLENLKSYKNNNQLTATNWDTLIDEMYSMDNSVANLLSKITNLNSQITNLTTQITNLENKVNNPTTVADVPSGAVMAFDLASCPSGWTRFSDADGRFIMGATSNSKEKGGSTDVKLTLENIPPHSHYYKDTVYAENKAPYSTPVSDYHKSVNGYRWLDAAAGDFYYGVTFSNEMIGSNKTDKDNNPIYGVRGSSMQLCDFGYREQTYVYGNRGEVDINGGFFNMLDLKTKLDSKCTSSSASSNTSFSVQNPYVKLIYCKKN